MYVSHVTCSCVLTKQQTSDPSDLCQVFTVIFAAEMVVKVVAMDPYSYFRVRLPVCCHLGDNDVTMAAVPHGNVLFLLLCCHGYR